MLILQLTNSLYTVFSISVYIRVFIEPEYDVPKWETFIGALRTFQRKENPYKPLKFYNPLIHFSQFLFAFAASMTGVVCIILSTVKVNPADVKAWYEYIIVFVVAVGWISVCFVLFRPIMFVNSGLYEKRLEETLRSFKEDNFPSI